MQRVGATIRPGSISKADGATRSSTTPTTRRRRRLSTTTGHHVIFIAVGGRGANITTSTVLAARSSIRWGSSAGWWWSTVAIDVSADDSTGIDTLKSKGRGAERSREGRAVADQVARAETACAANRYPDAGAGGGFWYWKSPLSLALCFNVVLGTAQVAGDFRGSAFQA